MKLLVSDLDGTLLGKEKLVQPEIVAAIQKWQAAGNAFAIATGRLYSSTLYYADRFHALDYVIGCSGATIHHYGELIEDEPISYDLVHKLWDYMNETEGYCQVYSDKRVIANRMDRVAQYYAKYHDIYGPEYAVPVTIEPDARKLTLPVHKLSFVFDSEEEAQRVLRALGDFKGYNLFRSLPYLFDIISEKADKGLSARRLQEILGASKLYTIGDNENDVAMLKLADYSAVIETAPEHVKEAADLVVAIPEQGGLVNFIEELLQRQD